MEWHLAADLKTLKLLNGRNLGSNAIFCYLYCVIRRVKKVEMV